MPRNPVLVGNRSFALKKDAEQACREILYRYDPGHRVSGIADELFLLDLLELHPQRNEKLGCGIAHFEVRVNPKFVRQRSFYLVRIDRSETDFSFMKCLRPPSHRQLVMGAMRHEVSTQVYEFAEETYHSTAPVLCAVTGRAVAREKAHVDHSSPTFLELAEQFVVEQGGWGEMVIARADGSIGVQLGRDDQASAWRDYHRRNATLRIVSIEANLSLLKRGSRVPG